VDTRQETPCREVVATLPLRASDERLSTKEEIFHVSNQSSEVTDFTRMIPASAGGSVCLWMVLSFLRYILTKVRTVKHGDFGTIFIQE
jgi:hypothetical protein